MRTETRRYLVIWICLMILLTLTCASAFVHLGAWNSAINMIIAVIKALLVALFFMHLRSGRALIRLLAATAVATLALLFVLSSSDYATRTLYPAPWQSPRQLPVKIGE